MLKLATPFVSIACIVVFAAAAWGQGGGGGAFTGGTGAGNNGSRNAGLQQTGQLSASAAIQRSATDTVGGSSGSFLSRNTQGGAGGNTGFNSALDSITGGLGLGMGLNGGRGGMGMGGMGMGGMGGQNQMSLQGTTGTPMVRTFLRLGFEPSFPESSAVSAQLTKRLPRIPGLESVSGLDVKMVGKTAVIQGVVASQRQRSLISRLAVLEPGISDVQNELTVDPELAERRAPPATVPIRLAP